MNRVVLVTGAAGFIGSHLVEHLLDRGDRVVGVDNFCDFYDPAIKRDHLKQAVDHDSFCLVEADIRDRDAVGRVFDQHRPTQVVHLAAMAGVRPSIERPGLYSSVNVQGTIHVLDAAAACGCQGFVFASSSSVYGNNTKVPFAETDSVDHPISPYAATKKAGELICHTYWHLHRLPVFCLRFFTVYGPRQRPDLAIGKFLRLLADRKPIPVFGDGSTSRDYTYIDDIVGGIVSAMDRCNAAAGGGIYGLGGNQPVSLNELIATLESVSGRKAQLQRLPMQPGDVTRTWAGLSRGGGWRGGDGCLLQRPVGRSCDRFARSIQSPGAAHLIFAFRLPGAGSRWTVS